MSAGGRNRAAQAAAVHTSLGHDATVTWSEWLDEASLECVRAHRFNPLRQRSDTHAPSASACVHAQVCAEVRGCAPRVPVAVPNGKWNSRQLSLAQATRKDRNVKRRTKRSREAGILIVGS